MSEFETETVLSVDDSIVVLNEPKWKKSIALFFAIAITTNTGLFTLWGYLNNYVASYFHYFDSSITFSTTLYTTTAWTLSQTCAIVISPIICEFLGFRIWIFTCCFMMASFVYASTLVTDFWHFLVIYGVGGGYFFGSLFLQPVYALMLMFPKKRGTISGLILAGYTLSPCFWGQICNYFVLYGSGESDMGSVGDYYDIKIAKRAMLFLKLLSLAVASIGCFSSMFIFTPEVCKGKLQFYIEKKWVESAKKEELMKNQGGFEPSSNTEGDLIDESLDESKKRVETGDLLRQSLNQKASMNKKKTRVAISQIYTSMLSQSNENGKIETIPNESIINTNLQTVTKARALGLVLRTKEFYLLFFGFLINILFGMFCVFNFNVLGQLWDIDLKFTHLVGLVGPVVNSIGSFVGGFVSDKFSFKATLKLISLIHMVVGVSMIFLGKSNWGYLVCFVLFFFSFGMVVTINPVACQVIYGHEIGPFALPFVNFGIVVSAFTATLFVELGQKYGFPVSIGMLVAFSGIQFISSTFIRKEVKME